MKNHLGASKGARSKMKRDKFVIFQYSYDLCFVPIIAPFQRLFRLLKSNKPAYILALSALDSVLTSINVS
ncbi:hypothetical protein R950_001299 [Salmonella enterica subsp. enterica]|nr:hypothetical protein [Salmonella enterica subsp. enterica serovar Langford]